MLLKAVLRIPQEAEMAEQVTMAMRPTNQLAVGEEATDFTLASTQGAQRPGHALRLDDT